jgi:hypothetical protein
MITEPLTHEPMKQETTSNTPETNEMAAMRRTHQEWQAHGGKLERERDEARAMASDMRNQFEKASTARLFFPWENTAISGGIHHPTNQ